MNPINAILLGVLVALALQRRNAEDHLGNWRWIAGAVGAIFPYTEIFLIFVSPGALAQGTGVLTWSLLVMPIYAVALAGMLGVMARRSWEDMFAPVVGGLAATWVLALLTEPGIFPLGLLLDWRVGLAVLDRFDVILFGLCVVGIGMGRAFRIYDRDLSRLTLLCVVGYVATVGFWSWQARAFGERYMATQELAHAFVSVEPQVLSPLNWRVMVSEPNGRLHTSLMTLGRGVPNRGREESDDPYRIRSEAVWKIFRRYGDMTVPEETQRQVRMAWYGWQHTAFGWLGRYAVYERMYIPQEVGVNVTCVGFKDFRAVTEEARAKGTFVICPWRGDRVRVFQPNGSVDKKGNWLGMHELVPYAGVRT